MVIDVIWLARMPFEATGKTFPAGDYRGAIITPKSEGNVIRNATQKCVVELPQAGEFDCTQLVENHTIIRKPL